MSELTYSTYTVIELKNELKNHGLSTTGKKAELLDRLLKLPFSLEATIKYPWASDFIEWLIPNLEHAKIPHIRHETDGDYYKLSIGKEKLQLDWKRLDKSEIDYVNDLLEPYGHIIGYKETDYGFFVTFNKSQTRSTKQIPLKDKEYMILVSPDQVGSTVNFTVESKQLTAKIVDINNQLCPSYYNRGTVCVWEGTLSATLNFGGKIAKISDHESRNNSSHMLILRDNLYVIQGLRTVVLNNSEDETYLIIHIGRVIDEGDDVLDDIIHIKSPIHKSFKLKLSSNPSTGSTWKVDIDSELETISHKYESACNEPIPGCGGYEVWTLIGHEKGVYTFEGRYGQQWLKTPIKPQIYQITIY